MEDVITRQKMTMTEEEFFAFVQEEIKKLRQHVAFEAKTEITFSDLQEKLEEYSPISFTLTELQARYRWQARAAKRSFDQWFDDKVVEVQQRYNRIDVAKTKWLTATEIERLARVAASDEYQCKLEALDSIEAREKFIGALIKNWESHSYVLTQMCNNVRSEVASLSMENRLSH
jgi:hypothetical protein